MIGIIGPEDSVALATRVAGELGRAEELIGLAYTDPGDAVSLARSLEYACDVLLFTGQVPFEQAKRSGEWRCDLEGILHSPADLYRMIAIVLKEHSGEFPRVTVDTIDEDTVRRAFADIGLAEPFLLPTPAESIETSGELARVTAERHAAAIAAGHATVALTCLAGTYRLLTEQGVDAWRIDHASITVRQALERGWYAAEMREASGRSPAVVLVTAADGDVLTDLEKPVTQYARRLGSRASLEDGRYVIATTRASVMEAVDRQRSGRRSFVDLATRAPLGSVRVGIGLGGTFDTSLSAATQALQLAHTTNEATIVREGGQVETVGGAGSPTPSLQETSPGLLRLAAETGLGPLTLRRLVGTLNRLDHEGVTAQQVAMFYGVTPRSARRMLSGLLTAGYAREAGAQTAAGAGRPHVVYSVDLPRISRLMASDD